MKHQHVQLLRRVAEEANVAAGQLDEAVEIYEEGEDSFSFRSWDPNDEDGLEYSVIAKVRPIEYLTPDNAIQPMLAVSVDDESEVVIGANGGVLFAIMYVGTGPIRYTPV